jgi:hypothetical protein
MRILGVVAATAALALMLPGISRSAPAAHKPDVTVRYMGEMSCGAWLATPRDYREIKKSATLNWVLGYVSGVSMVAGQDLLLDVDQASVAAWLDQYCAANPLDGLYSAANVLVNELSSRIGESSPFTP